MSFKYAQSALAAAALSLASHAIADEYQIEVGAGLIDGEFESDVLDDDIWGRTLFATTYFGVVDDDDGPLAEAAFINRASSLGISFIDFETRDTEIESENFGIAIRLVDEESGWSFGFGFDSGTVEQVDTEALSLTVGKYIAETTEVDFTFVFADAESTAGSDDTESYAFSIDHLFTGSLPVALGATIGSVEVAGENEQTAGVEVTLYPMRELGIGAAYEMVDGEEETTATSVFAQWFVTRAYAIEASYQSADLGETDAGDTETNLVTLGVMGRF